VSDYVAALAFAEASVHRRPHVTRGLSGLASVEAGRSLAASMPVSLTADAASFSSDGATCIRSPSYAPSGRSADPLRRNPSLYDLASAGSREPGTVPCLFGKVGHCSARTVLGVQRALAARAQFRHPYVQGDALIGVDGSMGTCAIRVSDSHAKRRRQPGGCHRAHLGTSNSRSCCPVRERSQAGMSSAARRAVRRRSFAMTLQRVREQQ
jgi:hypothetical protein